MNARAQRAGLALVVAAPVEYLTDAQIGAWLGHAPASTIRHWRDTGRLLGGVKPGRHWITPRHEVEAMLERAKAGAL